MTSQTKPSSGSGMITTRDGTQIYYKDRGPGSLSSFITAGR